ncbi:phenylacetate--CoA ligase family protein [Rubrivivax albus]|uniref:Phenylacetate--CoA ligase family protein n=1 Tax=Rubrivivax albus TaxID=2499835 RepID=A0A437JZC0_9BURK|nr:AMP-binding protein [Rubrivivax albus]RVT53457.1 phenylacetate--CoA ligase family protein [Rubrivivax albus]
MSAYTRLVSGLVFPLQEKLKHHDTVRIRRELEDSQWWSRERILGWQAERLRSLLVAAADVPYWRALFAERQFDPRAVTGVADLARLPLLDKATIRAHTDAMKHPQARGLARFNTGGSSGEPLIFYIGNERVSHDVAAKWRATRWWGVDIGDPEIVVWGSPIELGSQDRIRAWRDKLMRTQLLPAFEMSESKLDGFVARIRQARPRMLFGYPSALSHIARHAERRGQRMDDLGIRVAFVTSERLYDNQRADIERVFGCRVANGYGGRDAGFIAHQCPEGGMHLTAEDIVVEIVGEDGRTLPPGQPGEIVVTHLATRDFPFIRYRTGDVAVTSDAACPCGRGLPLLAEIQGRSTDFVVAQDGTVMHGLSLIYILRDMPSVQGFRIVQESLDLTRVQVVVAPGFGSEDESAIVSGFKRRLGSAVDVVVERVAAIPAEKSGKFRYVVSRVPSQVQAGVAAPHA